MSNENITQEKFRDSLATVTEEGKRNWVYPKQPKGRFYTARTVVSIFLLLFLVTAPFIKIDGHQFILLNFLERKFILFGIPFGPHDFHLFVLAIITVVVSIFMFTVVYGRIFCGWACPQTIFMEMVFRKIEYWIEGTASQQRALNSAPWTGNKVFKKVFKHGIFFALSFAISNIFLAYIIGSDQLIDIITDPPSEHLTGLFAITIFSGVFYFIFASFREQVCTLVCPYGRLQGVMLDEDSIVIAYDNVRGEPRGKLSEAKEKQLGDCIDCHLCVEVCPTGIDIRNGTQLECVNCTACIDACDSIMAKIKRPLGLIRYASKNEIEKKKHTYFTPRTIGYTIVLLLLLGLQGFLLFNRTDVELTVLRTPGMMYQEQPNGMISNLYDVKIINKTFESFPAGIKLHNMEGGEIKVIGSDLQVEPHEVEEAKFMVLLPKEMITQLNTEIEIEITRAGSTIDVIKTNFLGRVEEKE